MSTYNKLPSLWFHICPCPHLPYVFVLLLLLVYLKLLYITFSCCSCHFHVIYFIFSRTLTLTCQVFNSHRSIQILALPWGYLYFELQIFFVFVPFTLCLSTYLLKLCVLNINVLSMLPRLLIDSPCV